MKETLPYYFVGEYSIFIFFLGLIKGLNTTQIVIIAKQQDKFSNSQRRIHPKKMECQRALVRHEQ